MKRKIFILMLIISTFFGCATMFTDLKIQEAESLGKIHIGMSIQEVVQIVGRQPNTLADVFEIENREDGKYKTWEVEGGSMGSAWSRIYTFEFKDNSLVSWSSR